MKSPIENAALKTTVSIVPFVVLVALLALNISIFGSDAILGASQVALLFTSCICILLSMWLFKVPWERFEKAIADNVGNVTSAILILFLIGAISGTWTISGIVPSMICYGVKIIHPKVFLLTSCVICALVSLIIGSSWTTIATIGVALIGIGKAQGFSEGLIAGAIISGAYFGDKISPLSDTTVMASSVNGVPLFSHIRYMMVTTVPSMAVTLGIFTVLGFSHGQGDISQVQTYTEVLRAKFNITPWLFAVPVITGIMIWRKWPAFIVLALSTFFAGLVAIIFQRPVIEEIGGVMTEGSPTKLVFTGLVKTIYDSIQLSTGNPDVDSLVATKGMTGMLNTVYLIICAMCFGACMKASGMIAHLAGLIRRLARRRTSLVASTVTTGTALDALVCDQYLAIILTSNIFEDIYREEGYENRLLSRSVEDSATVTSPLFPWSSCGMTQATILSVPTLTYAPYCFFNIISPLMSVLIAATGYKIFRSVRQK